MEILRKIDLFQKEINALRQMEGGMLEQIRDYYRVGLTWTSNALEGNSLTESETKVLLEDSVTVGGKPLRDVFEAVDHAKAYDYMFSAFQERRIDEQAVLKMYDMFYRNIEPECAGRYRDVRVLITGLSIPWLPQRRCKRRWIGCLSGYGRDGENTTPWNLPPSSTRGLCSSIRSRTGTAGWLGLS